jgi:outer membrane protein assembly factor BamE
MKRATILTFLLGFASLTGCVFPGVYKLDVQQGNILSAETLSLLKSGMTESQVEFLLGTPVLKNPLVEKRWDYLYVLEQDDKVTHQYMVRVYFDEQGLYSHYEGDAPSEDDQVNPS